MHGRPEPVARGFAVLRAVADRYPRTTDAFVWVLSVIGFATFAHFVWQAILRDGGAAYDLSAYLLAGRHVLDGSALYPAMQINDPGAFRYPPIFAVLAVPLALAPEAVVTWLYRAACIGCVRYLVGSWRAVGVALLFVPLQTELIALNLTLPIAAAARAALRGSRSGVGALPSTAALKYGTAVLLPYLWFTRHDRTALPIGVAVLGGAFGLHAVIEPAMWGDYLRSLQQQAASANDAPWVGDQLLVVIPSTLWDFALRLAIGLALVVVAIRYRWDWLAFTAAAIAVPTLWTARLAALVGVPRLLVEQGRPRPVPERITVDAEPRPVAVEPAVSA